jgi:hypothetical protein
LVELKDAAGGGAPGDLYFGLKAPFRQGEAVGARLRPSASMVA